MAGEFVADFGRTAEDYRRFRAGFPPELVDRLVQRGIGRPDQHLLDLGTGTGSLARLLAPKVASVTGLDPAESLLDQAKELDRAAGVEITYRVATAEDTGLPDRSFDVVTAGQCWHWFDAERAAAESRRLLREDGMIVIAHFDWIPLPGNVVAATEELILKYNTSWYLGGGTGLYPRWLTDLALAGFRDIETFSFDLDVPYPPEAWVGRVRASAGVAASLPPDQVSEFADELNQVLQRCFPGAPLAVPHRTWAVTARNTDAGQPRPDHENDTSGRPHPPR
jgi:SAM-dependent methyltransferase